jgi:hypothetical protein
MGYFDSATPGRSLADCGCGQQQQPQQLSNGYHRRRGGRRRRGLSDEKDQYAQEIEAYVKKLKQQMSELPADAKEAREIYEKEIKRYEGQLREMTGTGGNPAPATQNGSSSEESFLTKDSLISGVPNWAVGAGAIVLGYVAYEMAT